MYKQLERYQGLGRPIRVGKYVRCSSDEQKKNGYTINDQLILLDDFCVEHGLISAGEYVDEGISATLEISKRKALSQLIKDAKAGKIDIVIFKCIDRFFRNVGEYYECQKQLRKAGVTWFSIEESDLDPEDDDAAFKINIYLTMAEYEAKKTSKRIHFNNKMRVKNKQVITGAQNFLFPWKVVGEPKQRHLERDMEKAEMLYAILDHFEKFNSKSRTVEFAYKTYGYYMALSTFNKLIGDTLLYGEYKGVADYVEPYISKERFDRLQILAKRNARNTEIKHRTYLFTGIIKCPLCNYNLTGNFTNNEYHIYRCQKHYPSRLCSNKTHLSERKVEKQLLENLEQYIANEIARVESLKEVSKPIVNHTNKIEELKTEMSRLNSMFRKGRISEEEYDKEFYLLERELKTFEVVEEPEVQNLDKLKELLESDWRSMYDSLDKEHKKAFWRNLIKEFKADENRKIIPESIIFF